MWKAQHELTQSLQSEARDAMKEARNSWAQEVRSLKAGSVLVETEPFGC